MEAREFLLGPRETLGLGGRREDIGSTSQRNKKKEKA
jgi:hypothetical protein